MADSKYSKNKNLWRKTYNIGPTRRPPVIESFVDSVSQITYSLDLQKILRHRDFFRIIKLSASFIAPTPPLVLGEYDEDLIHFNNESYKSFNYNFTFSSNPIVVYTQGTAASSQPNTENINIFGISKNTNGGVVGLSAPYSGTIRYRAAYAPSYPSYFTGSMTSIAPTAGTFVASIFADIPDNESFITASWAPLASSNPYVFMTPYEDNSNFDGNVALTGSPGTLSNSGEVIEISAPMSSSIYVLAVQ